MHILTPVFRLTAAACLCFLGCNSGSVSAATFAPTAEELYAFPKDAKKPNSNLGGLQAQIDGTGRTFYSVDDRRYPIDAMGPDSTFSGNSWPGGMVYYQFASTVTASNRSVWRSAANRWSSVAALTFVEGTGAGNYIFVQNSSGNNSYVGMIGGQQEMNIAQWYANVITHEIGHALGAEHEQSRSDRDSYVIINYANIQSGMASNFDVLTGSVNYGTYDFGSIMHYSRLAFSSNGQNTIQPRPAYSSYLYTMGTAEYLSSLDASGMAQRYARAPNDLFASRVAISGSGGGVDGKNNGAGKEPGEPNHHGQPGGASVWYTWTAPVAGPATLETFGSNFDTLLAVYTGNSASSLSYVASSDDSDGTLQSSVTFSAAAGVVYQIAVDGYDGAVGNIHLTWGKGSKADFNGDRKSDLVWQNNVTGQRSIWLMNGTTRIGAPTLPTVAKQWQIAGTGDFNSDDQVDIVWQDRTTGQRAIWLMNGTSLGSAQSLPTVPPQWEIAGTGDFNNDGQTDLVWQNNNTGQRSVWLMNGTSRVGDLLLPTVATQWRIAGIDDFNGDGWVDLVWQNNTTGSRTIWLMNGATKTGDRALPTLATQWQIAGTGDFNQDGRPDLLWQNNSTGQRSVWLMNGTTWVGSGVLQTVSPQWEIRNH